MAKKCVYSLFVADNLQIMSVTALLLCHAGMQFMSKGKCILKDFLAHLHNHFEEFEFVDNVM